MKSLSEFIAVNESNEVISLDFVQFKLNLETQYIKSYVSSLDSTLSTTLKAKFGDEFKSCELTVENSGQRFDIRKYIWKLVFSNGDFVNISTNTTGASLVLGDNSGSQKRNIKTVVDGIIKARKTNDKSIINKSI